MRTTSRSLRIVFQMYGVTPEVVILVFNPFAHLTREAGRTQTASSMLCSLSLPKKKGSHQRRVQTRCPIC